MLVRRAVGVPALVLVAALGLGRCTPAAPPRVIDTPDAAPSAEPARAAGPGPDAGAAAAGGAAPDQPDASTPDAEPSEAAAAAAPTDAAPTCEAKKKIRWLPAAPESWTQCGKDSHCTIVPDRCCTCGVLPASEARAVNRPSVENGNPFCGQQTGCPRCAGFPNPELEAVCLSGRCRIRETVDPCKPRRPGR